MAFLLFVVAATLEFIWLVVIIIFVVIVAVIAIQCITCEIPTRVEKEVFEFKVKYISSFVRSEIRAACPKDKLEFNYFRNLVPTYSLLWKVLISVLPVKGVRWDK